MPIERKNERLIEKGRNSEKRFKYKKKCNI